MTSYYKAVRVDGHDFFTGSIDYAAHLGTGVPVRHPGTGPMSLNIGASTYLSVSVEPAETLIGGSWPCRLLRVEPMGDVMDGLSIFPHKRAVQELLVVEELPAWMALGPQGQAVAQVIDQAASLTPSQVKALHAARAATWDVARVAAWYDAQDAARVAAWGAVQDAAWDAVRDAAWYDAQDAARDAAWDAARYAARDAARDTARAATWYAARDAAWYAAWYAVRDAAVAVVVRDLITDDQWEALAGPWISVMGDPFATTEGKKQ